MKNKLIVIRGPLGVGKTTVSKILTQNLNIEYLSLDQILKDNDLEGTDGIPLKNFLKGNKIISEIANKSKNSFIIDGCFYYEEQINDLKKKFDNDVIIFTLNSDVEKCIERDSKRTKVYGEDSARFVHMVTTKIQVGHKIDNSNLSIEETVEKIMNIINVKIRSKKDFENLAKLDYTNTY